MVMAIVQKLENNTIKDFKRNHSLY